jgi:hypothetical protein
MGSIFMRLPAFRGRHARQAKRRAGIQPHAANAEFSAGFPLTRCALAGMTKTDNVMRRA